MELAFTKVGTEISYDLIKNIYFKGIDDKYVFLKDADGNIKKINKSLFLKFGKIKTSK